jgi:hypothetical protein
MRTCTVQNIAAELSSRAQYFIFYIRCWYRFYWVRFSTHFGSRLVRERNIFVRESIQCAAALRPAQHLINADAHAHDRLAQQFKRLFNFFVFDDRVNIDAANLISGIPCTD